MKHLTLFLSLALLISCNSGRYIDVSLRLDGDAPTLPVTLTFTDTNYNLTFDEKGCVDVKVRSHEGFGYLEYYGAAVPLYAGDKNFEIVLNVYNDGRRNVLVPIYNGRGAKINFYRSKVRRNIPPYNLPVDEFMEQLAENLSHDDEALDTADVDKRFAAEERVRLYFDYMRALTGYPTSYFFMTRETATLSEDYYETLISIIEAVDGRSFAMRECREALVEAVNRLALRDVEDDRSVEMLLAEFDYLKRYLHYQPALSYVASVLAENYVRDRGIKAIDEFAPLCDELITEGRDHLRYDDAVRSWESVAPGNPLPPFGAMERLDSSGSSDGSDSSDGSESSEVKVEEFNGKYLLIACWLTRGGEAFTQMRELNEASKRFSPDSVQLLYLCGDGSLLNWRRVARSEQWRGVHLGAGEERDFINALNIYIYPRYILVDRDGMIIDNMAPAPGSEEFEEMVQQYFL